MKVLLFLFLFYMPQNEIPKKANKIIIHTDKTAEGNYNEFGRFLIEEGFTFEKSDREFLMLKTDTKTVKNVPYKLAVTFLNSDIIIRIKYSKVSPVTLRMIEWYDWYYEDFKACSRGVVFADINPILQRFSKKVEYLIAQ